MISVIAVVLCVLVKRKRLGVRGGWPSCIVEAHALLPSCYLPFSWLIPRISTSTHARIVAKTAHRGDPNASTSSIAHDRLWQTRTPIHHVPTHTTCCGSHVTQQSTSKGRDPPRGARTSTVCSVPRPTASSNVRIPSQTSTLTTHHPGARLRPRSTARCMCNAMPFRVELTSLSLVRALCPSLALSLLCCFSLPAHPYLVADKRHQSLSLSVNNRRLCL